MSSLQQVGKRLDNVKKIIKNPNDLWILEKLSLLFEKAVDSLTNQTEEDSIILKLNELVDSFEFRFGKKFESKFNKKQLQERIKKFVQKKLKEQDAGFVAGTGYQHQGKKPKNETKNYQNPPKDGKGVPTVFTKGTADLSAYKNIGYREVKPSEMIDAAYLWAGKGGLKENINESRYSTFKKQTEVVKPSSQMHTALKEVFKQLKEANRVASYTKQLKNELSENNDVAYNKRSEAIIDKLIKETAQLYKNLKEIKDGTKGKN